MAGPKPISIAIVGDADKFNKTMDGVSGKLGGLGKVAAAGGLAIAAGIGIGAKALFDIGSQAQEMRNNIIEGTGASGEALDAFVSSAKEVLKTVPESSDVVSGALADVNTFFGATGDQLEDMTGDFLDFARVTGTDVGAAIGQVDAALTQFGLSAGDADEVMGDFLRISQATGAPMDKLLGQMETFGPIFDNAGFSLEETTAIFGQLETAGVDVTRVGPALNKFFRDTAAAGDDPKQAFKDIQAAMLAAGSETEALNIATAAFGSEGAQRMTSAIRNGSLDLENLNELMGDGTGLVGEQAAATETFGDKWNMIKNNVFVALEPLAVKMFDAIQVGMDWLLEHQPEIEAGFNAFKDVVVEVGTAIAEKLQPVMEWLIEHWPEIQEGLRATGEVIKTVITIVIEIGRVIGEVAFFIGEKIGQIIGFFINLSQNIWSKTLEIVEAIKAIIGWFQALHEKVKDVASKVVEAITSIPDKIKALGSRFLDAGKSLGTKIIDGIKSGISKVGGVVSSLAGALKSGLKNVINTGIIDPFNNGLRGVTSLVNKIPGVSISAPSISRLFKGTENFGGGLAMVGEHGRELVNLPAGSQVLTNRQTEAAVSSSNTMAVTINAKTNADPFAIANELAWIYKTNGR